MNLDFSHLLKMCCLSLNQTYQFTNEEAAYNDIPHLIRNSNNKKYIFWSDKKEELDYLIGKIAFFSDIALNLGNKKSFGVIYAIRKSLNGNIYFVRNLNADDKNLKFFKNTSPCVLNISSEEVEKYIKPFSSIEQNIANNYLNKVCTYIKGTTINYGYIKSFSINHLTIENIYTNEIIDVPVVLKDQIILNKAESINDL